MPRTKADARTILSNVDIPTLEALERKILWLSSWMIHNANHVRESRDGLKVGGHQSSCASAATLLTALYLHSLRPEDRVAVKPHAAPVFHAIQYLLGRQDLAKLQDFRALGGAQSYPSRTKDTDDVDFSTGSVGLGVGATLFGAMVRDYVHHHGLAEGPPNGRLVALMAHIAPCEIGKDVKSELIVRLRVVDRLVVGRLGSLLRIWRRVPECPWAHAT